VIVAKDMPSGLSAVAGSVQGRRYGWYAAAMTVELEAKLVPGEGFQMPALQDALPGTDAVVQPVRELDAI
jgi:hypothetical protein